VSGASGLPAGARSAKAGTRAFRAVGIQQVDATLKLLEAGRLALRVEGDDLAVEDQWFLPLARPLSQGGGDFGELTRFVVAQPRPQPHDAAWHRSSKTAAAASSC